MKTNGSDAGISKSIPLVLGVCSILMEPTSLSVCTSWCVFRYIVLHLKIFDAITMRNNKILPHKVKV